MVSVPALQSSGLPQGAGISGPVLAEVTAEAGDFLDFLTAEEVSSLAEYQRFHGLRNADGTEACFYVDDVAAYFFYQEHPQPGAPGYDFISR